MDLHKEFRLTYLGAAPHSITVGLLWVISGIISNYTSVTFTILFFFFAAGLNFPIGEFFRKLLKTPNFLSTENHLPKLFSSLSLTIPLSIPLVYMACQYNINWFFPAFAVIVGAHYLPFIWAYKLPSFGVLGILIVVSGSFIAYFIPESFDLAAYTTGGLIILFGVIHFLLVKKEIINIKSVLKNKYPLNG